MVSAATRTKPSLQPRYPVHGDNNLYILVVAAPPLYKSPSLFPLFTLIFVAQLNQLARNKFVVWFLVSSGGEEAKGNQSTSPVIAKPIRTSAAFRKLVCSDRGLFDSTTPFFDRCRSVRVCKSGEGWKTGAKHYILKPESICANTNWPVNLGRTTQAGNLGIKTQPAGITVNATLTGNGPYPRKKEEVYIFSLQGYVCIHIYVQYILRILVCQWYYEKLLAQD
jgi:hypothetical protein